ncbi:MAG TPA: xanthine dehydrogenase family protein subunit M [Burkholderiales bacterium]|nr:xanthine dehydrogenase family protein subunit M [Burkholderiales bacterium]
MRRFAYFAPATLDEAVALLGRYDGKASVLAGGTDLLVEIKEQLRRPDQIIDIKKIPAMAQLAYHPDHGLKIGALVTTRQIETSPVVLEKYPGLAQAVRELGSIQIRNRATLAGNVCRASPSADTLPPLMADRARVTLYGPRGSRTVALEAFFTGPGRTVMRPDELMTEIRLPPPPPRTGKAYIKHGRRKAMELATVGVAVSVTLQENRFREVDIVLGAVAPTPLRALKAEAILRTQEVSEELIEEAAIAAMSESKPISNVRASADYRREMVAVLTRRALRQALGLIR